MSSLSIVNLLLDRYNRNIERTNALSNTIQALEDKIEQAGIQAKIRDYEARLKTGSEKLAKMGAEIERRESLIQNIDIGSGKECDDTFQEIQDLESCEWLAARFEKQMLENSVALYEDQIAQNSFYEEAIKNLSSMLVSDEQLDNQNLYLNEILFAEEDLARVRMETENILKNLNDLHHQISKFGHEHADRAFVYKRL